MKEGWKIVKLGEVCESITAGGDKPINCTKVKTSENKIPVFANGEKNMGLYGFTDNATETDPCITISARGTIGFCCIRTEPFVPIVRLIVCIPSKNILLKYLYYYISSLDITHTGSSIPQLVLVR